MVEMAEEKAMQLEESGEVVQEVGKEDAVGSNVGESEEVGKEDGMGKVVGPAEGEKDTVADEAKEMDAEASVGEKYGTAKNAETVMNVGAFEGAKDIETDIGMDTELVTIVAFEEVTRHVDSDIVMAEDINYSAGQGYLLVDDRCWDSKKGFELTGD